MTTGPVSEALHSELLQEVRRQGIVVWLDKDASYTGFVNQLAEQHEAGAFPFPVVGFRGSFIEILFALESYGSGYDKHSVVVHMPGYNEDSIRTTPVLELYAAGTRFRKGLDTLIRQAATGRVLPVEVEVFLRGKPTLEEADEWLIKTASRRSVGLEPLLESSGSTLILDALVRKDSNLSQRVKSDEEVEALKSYLHKLTGMDEQWIAFAADKRPYEQTICALGAWLLCVEYVHDLRREPYLDDLKRLKQLTAPLVKVSIGLLVQLRKQYPAEYEKIADETETMLAGELAQMKPEDLGHVDTFREEEIRILQDGAVNALKQHNWAKAVEWCKAREGEKSFWLQRMPERRRAWNLVAEAADFGKTLAEHSRPFENLHNHEDALARYMADAALVDRAHRRIEQEWLRRLDTQMPHYGDLQEVLGELRRLHRGWVDQLAKDFTKLCKAEGFLPPAHLQQRNLYEQVVQPLAFGGEKIAIFMLDAFRYEMATELIDDLRAIGGGAVVDLKARFAELPTITSVGMNALAPVAKDGNLVVTGSFRGFRAGESTVSDRNDRVRAMGTRTSGKAGLQLALSEVCDASAETLKRRVKEHQVIVICASEIDDAGEANVGLMTFELQIRQIRAAWHHLQGAGVKQAVFTADHGFLLQDTTVQLRDFGKKTTPHRRYVLDEHERGENGVVPVSLAKLGYEGISGYVLVPDDSAAFNTGASGGTFVHGGNSPQERIIPVLTITRKRAESSSLTAYAVEAEPMPDAFGFKCLRMRLKDAQQTLGFVAARSIELDLRVPERADIRATLKEVSGAGKIKSGRLQVPVGDDWTIVFFALEGVSNERVPIEIYHADKIEKVTSGSPDCLYQVSFDAAGGQRPGSKPSPSMSWADNFEDDGIRSVFLHIDKHGAIVETELIAKLGGSRAARKFALNFEEYIKKLPFNVRSESSTSGKRYVREEEK